MFYEVAPAEFKRRFKAAESESQGAAAGGAGGFMVNRPVVCGDQGVDELTE